MRRREFITLLGGATAWPVAARAQQPAMPVIGFLSIRSSHTDVQLLASFRQGLGEVGFVEGRNVAIEYRYAEGQPDRLPPLAADLVHRQVAVIVTTGGAQAALATKAATTTIPIVFTIGADPVRAGLVQSLNRPGGNLTGVTTSYDEAAPKRLGLLLDILPKAAIIGVLVNPNDPITAASETNDMRNAARSVGRRVEILQAGSEHDIDAAFARLADMRADALVVAPDALFATQAHQLIGLAARHAIPTLYWRREFAGAGGLMTYGSSLGDALRVLGVYTGRILKGEKPDGVEMSPVNLRDAGEIERAITSFARGPNGGLIVTASALALVHRDLIVTLAARHKLPAIYWERTLVTGGGLVSYGPDFADQFRHAAGYVDRILKGEKPADLPVQAPTKYELVINLKTAKALGLTMPDTVLARADEVIE